MRSGSAVELDVGVLDHLGPLGLFGADEIGADLIGSSLAFLSVEIGNDDPGTLFLEAERNGLADARGSPVGGSGPVLD